MSISHPAVGQAAVGMGGSLSRSPYPPQSLADKKVEPPDVITIEGHTFEKVKPHLPFLGGAALAQFDRLSRQMHRHHDMGMRDQDYLVELVKTMDAVKDVVEYTMAQIKVLEMTYAKDLVRLRMHCDLLRGGFMSLVEKSMRREKQETEALKDHDA